MFVLIKMMLPFCLLITAGLLSLVRDIEPDKFKNNVLALGDTAKYFNLPTILTTSFETGPNGPLVPELKAQFPIHLTLLAREILTHGITKIL